MTADPLEKHAQEQERRSCKHPNVQFKRMGFELSCVDCKRRWCAAIDGFDIADFTYLNPQISESEFRHSPNELPRREPKPEKSQSSKIR